MQGTSLGHTSTFAYKAFACLINTTHHGKAKTQLAACKEKQQWS